MIFPALLDAAKDPVFVDRPSAFLLYGRLLAVLEFTQFRRVRAGRLAADMHVRPDTVYAGLKILRDAGYIERGDRLLDVYTYRLVYSLAQSEPSPKRETGA